jgi:hypothetical protein
MSVILYLLWIILGIIIIIGVWFVFDNIANAQTAPPPVTPTAVPTPTPTSPNPNLQYLPQKAYVQAYAPENGIPSTSGQLQVVPTVVPQTQNSLGGFDLGSILPTLIAAGSGIFAKMGFDKAKKAEATSQSNAEMYVKQATVQSETLKQVYENMPNKGNEITNKPEIKLDNVENLKSEALKTAAKA